MGPAMNSALANRRTIFETRDPTLAQSWHVSPPFSPTLASLQRFAIKSLMASRLHNRHTEMG
jgi:hypothetical protein